MIAQAVLIVTLATSVVVGRTSINSIVSACPSEGGNCAAMAINGYCQVRARLPSLRQGTGASPIFAVLWQRCACSCMHVANTRVQQCCRAVGAGDEANDCLHLCRRDLSVTDRCSAFLPHFIHCGSEGVDVRECCRAEGLPAGCMPICSGSASSACGNLAWLLSSYLACAPHREAVRTCYMKHNPRRQDLKKLAEWTTPC